MRRLKIAFIGLGLMGRLMSARLAQAGYVLKTHDKNGSGAHPTPRLAAEGADILITMLPDGKVVGRVVRAALPALRRGSLVIDMSSSDPADTRALGTELRRHGVSLIDAPVSGAKAKAKDGTLAIMVGGDAATLKRARPVLSKLGTEIFHTGKLGSGHATKALNNYLGAAGTIAGFEALLVGKKYGLDPRVLVDVINASTGKNSTTERKIPQQIFTGAFASGFQIALMAKDVGIANAIARKTGVETPYLRNTLKIWRAAERRLAAGADHTELYKYLSSLTRSKGSRRTRRRNHT
jgi:3-hydroxyisobutyrate dehydrogenase